MSSVSAPLDVASGTPNRCDACGALASRQATGIPRAARTAARGHSARVGLGAGRRRIWWNGSLAGDLNVGGTKLAGAARRTNRERRLGDQTGHADRRTEDGRFGTGRSPHRAGRRLTSWLVVHRAHGACTVSARALRRMRVCRGDPQGDGHERHRADLAAQPDSG
jgi:hypothetical protein